GVPIPGLHAAPDEMRIKAAPRLGVRLVEWFQLTDRSSASVRQAVRLAGSGDAVLRQLDRVLAKLGALRGKTFERERFQAELARRLDKEEQARFQDLLLKHTARPSHTLAVPVEVRATLGIRKGEQDHVEIVRLPTQTRPLVVYGSTALDPTRLMR